MSELHTTLTMAGGFKCLLCPHTMSELHTAFTVAGSFQQCLLCPPLTMSEVHTTLTMAGGFNSVCYVLIQ